MSAACASARKAMQNVHHSNAACDHRDTRATPLLKFIDRSCHRVAAAFVCHCSVAAPVWFRLRRGGGFRKLETSAARPYDAILSSSFIEELFFLARLSDGRRYKWWRRCGGLRKPRMGIASDAEESCRRRLWGGSYQWFCSVSLLRLFRVVRPITRRAPYCSSAKLVSAWRALD